MDNHSEYLTEKVRYGYSGKDIMRMTSCAVLGILFIWAVITTTNPFEIAEILAAVILLVPTFLLFWKGTMGPVFRNRDSSIAGRISEQLRLSEIPEVSIVSLEKILDMKNLDLTQCH